MFCHARSQSWRFRHKACSCLLCTHPFTFTPVFTHRADKETKIKQAKLAQIKKISGQISKVDNEIHKYKKQLEACYKYRNFLLSLTPVEHKQWVAQQKQAKKQERELRRRERRLAREMKNASLGDGDDTNNLNDPNNPAFNPDNPGYAALNDPAYDSEDEDSDDSIDEMYFKRPEQLLEYFSHLEERNLFLIQNVQQDEEALEELKQKFKETEELMEEKTNKLRKTINELNRKIEAENRRAELFNRRTKNNESAGNQQKLLKSLSDRVRWVYNQCSRFNVSHQTDPLDMLMEIERFLEKQLNEIRSMDQAKVTEAEKERESARRLHVRKEKKKEQNRIYLDRMEKSKLRSEAEVFRRVGKQVMFRSAPRKKKTKKEDKTNEKDRQEKEMIESFFKV